MDTTSGYSRARTTSPYGTRSTTGALPAAASLRHPVADARSNSPYGTRSASAAAAASASLVHPVAVRPAAALPLAARPVVSPAGGLSSSPRASGGAVAAVAPTALSAILNSPTSAAAASAPASAPQEQASTKRKRDEVVVWGFVEDYARDTSEVLESRIPFAHPDYAVGSWQCTALTVLHQIESAAQSLVQQHTDDGPHGAVRGDALSKEERDIEAEAFAYAKQKPSEALGKYVARGVHRTDREFFQTVAQIAVGADWTALAQVPESLRDLDLCLLALGQSERALGLAPQELRALLRQHLARADEFLS